MGVIGPNQGIWDFVLTINWYKSELRSLIYFHHFWSTISTHCFLSDDVKKMRGIRVGFQTKDGQSLWISFFFLGGGGVNFHENVRRELLNYNQICPSLYKILFSKGTHFIHMNYHTLFLKTCQNIKFNKYENHFSRKQRKIQRENNNWYIFNKNQFSISLVVSGKL